MSLETLTVEVSDRSAVVTLSRPAVHNALNDPNWFDAAGDPATLPPVGEEPTIARDDLTLLAR